MGAREVMEEEFCVIFLHSLSAKLPAHHANMSGLRSESTGSRIDLHAMSYAGNVGRCGHCPSPHCTSRRRRRRCLRCCCSLPLIESRHLLHRARLEGPLPHQLNDSRCYFTACAMRRKQVQTRAATENSENGSETKEEEASLASRVRESGVCLNPKNGFCEKRRQSAAADMRQASMSVILPTSAVARIHRKGTSVCSLRDRLSGMPRLVLRACSA